MSYDTVIIGAGLSGLAAGIRLAYFDKKVCIVERHYTIGGLNSFYRLRKRDHDVGLHAVTNFAEPGTRKGPLSKLLRQLRLRWEDFPLCPQTESSIVFPGHTLRFNNDLEYLKQNIAEQFPSQVDNLQKLLSLIDEHDDLHLTDTTASTREVLKSVITDDLLIEMLLCPMMFYGSATPGDMDFTQFVIIFKSIFYQGLGRPVKGVRQILKSVVEQFRQTGGELRLRCGVEKILTDNGRAVGVKLESGEVLEAKTVLSSAGSAETMRLCSAPQQVVDRNPPGEISFVETIFTLDCQPRQLDHNETMIFFSNADAFRYESPAEPCDLQSGIICSPNNFDYQDSTEAGRIRITALANPDYWFNLSDGEYYAQKDRWCDRIVRSSLRHMPDIRRHIVDADMFTPRTITKYTGHWNGAVYGAPKKIRDGRTHLENLFLCGTDQGFLGIVGAMVSGITMANMYLLR